MKVRLIQPSQLDENGKRIKHEKLFLPFLTSVTLAGLTPGGIDIGLTNDYVEDIDFDEDADLVAVTAQTCQAPRAYQIADEFRKRGRSTILGGIHASMCPDEALQHADAVLVGEAEDLWEQVIADAGSHNLKRLYKAERKPDLSRHVVPRFDLLNFDHYVVPPFARTPLIPIQTSRGCPHQCDFCSVTSFLGNRIRTKPVANVIGEIESVRPSRVFFTDDNIVGDPVHARALFEAMKPLKLRWACQMSTRILNHPDLIQLAAESGCHETFIGIESLKPETLRSVHKGFNNTDEYALLFRKLKEVGILAQASFVFGLDGDNADDLRRTLDRVLAWDVNYMYIFVLTPLPGTRLYAQMKEDGRLLSEDWSLYDVMHPVLKFKNLSATDLFDCLWECYGKFYSTRNILARAWRFKREYIAFFPRDMAIEEIFFQLHMRKAVKRHEHPFSLGLRKDPL